MRFLAVFLNLVSVGVAHAEDSRAKKFLERDKASCNEHADEKVGYWILHMSEWNVAYNTCLQSKLTALEKNYINVSLEALRLESLCPESTLHGPPVDFSVMGITIAKQLSEKEKQKSGATHTLEHTLELYYQRTLDNRERVRELRKQ